jgi:hypothetical protein
MDCYWKYVYFTYPYTWNIFSEKLGSTYMELETQDVLLLHAIVVARSHDVQQQRMVLAKPQ